MCFEYLGDLAYRIATLKEKQIFSHIPGLGMQVGREYGQVEVHQVILMYTIFLVCDGRHRPAGAKRPETMLLKPGITDQSSDFRSCVIVTVKFGRHQGIALEPGYQMLLNGERSVAVQGVPLIANMCLCGGHRVLLIGFHAHVAQLNFSPASEGYKIKEVSSESILVFNRKQLP